MLQPYQAYSQLYYESKLKAIIDEKYKEHLETLPESERKKRFQFGNSLTKSMYEGESDKVKEEVERYRKKQAAEGIVDFASDGEDEEGEGLNSGAQQDKNRLMQQ